MSIRNTVKQEAVLLRKQGLSYSQIQSQVHVSSSSLSLWLRDVSLSTKAQRVLSRRVKEQYRLRAERRKAHTISVLEKYLTKARADMVHLDITPELARLLVSLLHYCEGEKTHKGVYFTNSDKDLVTAFLILFRRGFNIREGKFRVCMHLHSYHDERLLKQFWSQVTHIPESKFIKSFRKKETGKTRKEGYNGCVSIRYHDAAIAKEILMTARAFFEKMGP